MKTLTLRNVPDESERLQVCLEEADLLVIPAVVLEDLYAGFEMGARKVANEARRRCSRWP